MKKILVLGALISALSFADKGDNIIEARIGLGAPFEEKEETYYKDPLVLEKSIEYRKEIINKLETGIGVAHQKINTRYVDRTINTNTIPVYATARYIFSHEIYLNRELEGFLKGRVGYTFNSLNENILIYGLGVGFIWNEREFQIPFEVSYNRNRHLENSKSKNIPEGGIFTVSAGLALRF